MFKKKLPLIYNAIVKTGLASIPELPPLHEINDNVLLPDFVANIGIMKNDELKSMLTQFSPLFIHNCVVSDDFPFDSQLRRLLKTHERKIEKIRSNAWVRLMYGYGERNSCPDPSCLEVTLSSEDQAALALCREQWSKRASEFVMDFVEWTINNKDKVDAWYLNRFEKAKEAKKAAA